MTVDDIILLCYIMYDCGHAFFIITIEYNHNVIVKVIASVRIRGVWIYTVNCMCVFEEIIIILLWSIIGPYLTLLAMGA